MSFPVLIEDNIKVKIKNVQGTIVIISEINTRTDLEGCTCITSLLIMTSLDMKS